MKIAVFYHLFQHGNWLEIFNSHIFKMQKSGLFDAIDYLHIGINPKNEKMERLYGLVEQKANKIVQNNNVHLESDTLNDLWKFCNENPDHKVLYLHAKGVSWVGTQHQPVVDSWRNYLDHFVINRWKDCTRLLDLYDTVGTEWERVITCDKIKSISPCYAGNFWWAKAKYISSLDPHYLYKDLYYGWLRWQGEFWIGTGNPDYFNFNTFGKKFYGNSVNPQDYEGNYDFYDTTK
jgi:hypothetical protein